MYQNRTGTQLLALLLVSVFAITVFVPMLSATTPNISAIARATNTRADDVYINELMPNPEGSDSDFEWAELYNAGSDPISLDGWVFDDDKQYTFSGTQLNSGAFLVLAKNAAMFQSRYPSVPSSQVLEYSDMGLANSGDDLVLYDASEQEVDSYSYYSSTDGVSWGRSPDGGAEWVTLSVPSPGESNSGGVPLTYDETDIATLASDPASYADTNITLREVVVHSVVSEYEFTVSDTNGAAQLSVICEDGSNIHDLIAVNDTLDLYGIYQDLGSEWALFVRADVGTDRVELIASAPVDYITVTLDQLLTSPASYENAFVRVENVTVTRADMAWNFEVNQDNGTEWLTVYVDQGGDRPDQLYTGDILNVQGAFIDYMGTWEIKVRAGSTDHVIVVESAGPPPGPTADYVLRGKVVTMESKDAIIPSGNVYVNNEMIEAVWPTSEAAPAGVNLTDVPVIDTNGIIFPGLIDTHNHVHYNTIPLWDVPKQYTNRYQWGNHWSYKPDITYPKVILTTRDYADMLFEAMKYAEVKELVGGGVAIQGSPGGNSGYDDILVRNLELRNFGQDKIYQNVREVDSWDPNYILDRYNSGRLEAFFAHLGEGTDEKAHGEFETLKNMGLNIDAMVHIHATAWERSDFQEMPDGAGMVWSPASNLLLYGDTAKVDIAWEEGVTVALAPDWAPSGAKNNLGELKIADQWNKLKLNNFFSDYNLTEMVTTNAAKLCRWEQFCGRVKEGLHADLMVINDPGPDVSPYRALIDAIDFDVKLVTIDGDPLYGMVDWFEELKPGDYEVIQGKGFERAVDVTKEGVPGGDQTFNEIQTNLEEVMDFTPEALYDRFDIVDQQGMTLDEFGTWLDEQFDDGGGLHPVPLDPIFTYGDTRYFHMLNTSSNFNLNWNPDIYSYYDRRPTEGNVAPIVPLPAELTVKYNESYFLSLPITDPDTPADEIAVSTDSENVIYHAANETLEFHFLTGTPTQTVQVVVTDGITTVRKSVVVSFIGEGETYPPVFSVPDSLTLTRGEPYWLPLAITDPDTPQHMLSVETDSLSVVYLASNGTLRFQFPLSAEDQTVNITVSDGVQTIVRAIAISLEHPPGFIPPTLTLPSNITIYYDRPHWLPITITDPDTPRDELIVATDTASASYVASNQTLRFEYPTGMPTQTVTVSLSDGRTVVRETVTVQFYTVDTTPPSFNVPSSILLEYETPVTLPLRIDDPDTAPAQLQVFTSSPNVDYLAASGALRFEFAVGTPDQTVTVTVTDGLHPVAKTIAISFIAEPSPPTVASVIPDRSAVNTPRDGVIAITFSEPMRESSLTLTLKNEDGDAVDGIVRYREDRNRLSLLPLELLAPNANYTAELAAGATATTGTALDGAYSWTFTTEPAPADVITPVEGGGDGEDGDGALYIWIAIAVIVIAGIIVFLLILRM